MPSRTQSRLALFHRKYFKNLDVCYAILSKQSTLGLFDMVAQDFGRFIETQLLYAI